MRKITKLLAKKLIEESKGYREMNFYTKMNYVRGVTYHSIFSNGNKSTYRVSATIIPNKYNEGYLVYIANDDEIRKYKDREYRVDNFDDLCNSLLSNGCL